MLTTTRRRFLTSVTAMLATLPLMGCNRPNRIKLKKLKGSVTEVSCDDPDTLFNFWDYYQTDLWPEYKKHTTDPTLAKDIVTVTRQTPNGKLYLWDSDKFCKKALDTAVAKSRLNGITVICNT